jgi:hypothetical protein
LLNFFTMTEFWDKPAEKSGKVLAAFLEGQPLVDAMCRCPAAAACEERGL